MEVSKRTWIIGAGFILLLFGFLVFIPGSQKGKIISVAMKTDNFSQEIRGLTYLRFRGNFQEWKIRASMASIQQEKAILSDINAIYSLPDHTSLRIYADQGVYDRGKDVFTAKGIRHDINVYIDNTFNIVTRELLWTGDNIYGKGTIYVKGKNFFLKGKGLKGSIRDGIYEIEKDIIGFIW